MLTRSERLQAIAFCFRKSWRVRLTPETSWRLIHDCLDLIEREGVYDTHLRRQMQVKVKAAARRTWRPVKSVWVAILLQVVLPAIIKWVIEWWLKRRRAAA